MGIMGPWSFSPFREVRNLPTQSLKVGSTHISRTDRETLPWGLGLAYLQRLKQIVPRSPTKGLMAVNGFDYLKWGWSGVGLLAP